MALRYAFDIGTNSIGWAILDIQSGKPREILSTGVRIFSDGRNKKDGSSLAVQRREPRSARRNRDRYLKRRSVFLEILKRQGLMPVLASEAKVLEGLDPWILRARGLDEELTVHELGRALFHLQQRRGFKSNRKADRGSNEGGVIAEATAKTEQMLMAEGVRTLGEFFGRRRLDVQNDNKGLPKGERKPQPAARVSPYKAKGNQMAYDYYPTRDLIHREFDALWAVQKTFHPDILTDEVYAELEDALFFQRSLKAPPIGRCTFDMDEPRAPKALPSLQRWRIFQDANHLSYRLTGETSQPLTQEQRDKVVAKLLASKTVKFDSLRKTVLKLPETARFNFEVSRTALKGDETAAVLAHKDRWGPSWRDLPLDRQDEIVTRLLETEDPEELVNYLQTEHGLSAEAAEKVADVPLPAGHASVCKPVAEKLLECLSVDVTTYDKAVEVAGYGSHSRLDHQGEILAHLPYYGELLQRHVVPARLEKGVSPEQEKPEKRYGKVANPTVHVALNQIRRVANDLVDRFGPPDEIVVELARDLPLSAKGKSELKSLQNKNEKANDERRKLLSELGQADTYSNRLRVRLWEELHEDVLERRCPFTGEQISAERLFSDAFEIEHILPKSRTLDDSPANKTLSARSANRYKRERSPFEAFGQSLDGYDWEHISMRASFLPGNKAWRFAPDAMERFESEDRDFADRQLNSTQYIARLAANYLVWLVGDPSKVWVVPGRMTSDLRHHWGLNTILALPGEAAKNRNDHRHHAIDAIVVGLTDRPLLQRLARDAKMERGDGDARLINDLQDPWPNFRHDVEASIRAIIVSHKPDHGIQGGLHNDTAYGLKQADGSLSEADKSGKRSVVHRVPLDSLETPAKLESIRDDWLRHHFLEETQGLSGEAFKTSLRQAAERLHPPVKKVRIEESMKVVTISDRDGKPYKAYKGDSNYCYDIWADEKGNWTGEVVSRFHAHSPGFDPKRPTGRDGQPLIMRLRKDDMISITENGKRRIMVVAVITPGKVSLFEQHEANVDSRNRDKIDPFSYLTCAPSRLQKLQAVPLRVSPSGQVFRDNRFGPD